jgi:hypothetical protein
MTHPIHRVTSFEGAGPHTLRVGFDDGTTQVIDFHRFWRARSAVLYEICRCSIE